MPTPGWLKHLCSIRAWVPVSFSLSLSLSLYFWLISWNMKAGCVTQEILASLLLSLSHHRRRTTRFRSIKGPQQIWRDFFGKFTCRSGVRQLTHFHGATGSPEVSLANMFVVGSWYGGWWFTLELDHSICPFEADPFASWKEQLLTTPVWLVNLGKKTMSWWGVSFAGPYPPFPIFHKALA